jgi:methylenetetrahydrofolate dehydrogenase (NADP+)/methenyltetrahydrofolate cyclohydrolase
MTLLQHYGVVLRGKIVTVIGQSNIVGKPMGLMLMNAGATVISCNSSTLDLRKKTLMADILIVAAGKPRLITEDMVQPSAIVIDVGNTFIDGVVYGDTDFEALHGKVSGITPTPGGVGPMTVATLIENTWKAYKAQRGDL